jgi:hypothetical protein
MITPGRAACPQGNRQNCIVGGEVIAVLKIPVGILVHRCPLGARLYLFSPDPRILEVIIRKNAETGRKNLKVSGGNG